MKIMVTNSQVDLINEILWADIERGEGAAFDFYKSDMDNSKKFLVPLSMMIPNQTDKDNEIEMSTESDQRRVKDIIKKLKSGGSIPPIILHKMKKGYLIVDGHHRYEALKRMGKNYGLSVIIPSKNVRFVDDHKKSLHPSVR